MQLTIILRELGADALAAFKIVILGMHQEEHYFDGLKKLGIGGCLLALAGWGSVAEPD